MTIDEYRDEIDAIDAAVVRLLNRRAAAAKQIGKIKALAGLPVADTERESEIERNIRRHNRGAWSDESLQRIFREVIAESRRSQVACVGEIDVHGEWK